MARASPPATRSVDAIVQEIYGSLLEDVSIKPCLQTLGRVFRAHVTSLHSQDPVLGRDGIDLMGEIQGPEFLKLVADYAARWAGQNLWVIHGSENLMVRGYGSGEEVVADRDLVCSEYYKYFLKPLDIRAGLGISVGQASDPTLAILTLNRSSSQGPFSLDELQLAGILRPHLVNAYAIYRRLACLADETSSLRASFDRMPLGILVLDRDGRIVEQNAEAARLLLAGIGISCAAGGRLHLANAASQSKFLEAIARLVGGHHPSLPEAILVARSRESGAGSLALHLCAFPPSAGPVLAKDGRILAFLCELNRHSDAQFAARMLQVALDLTPMEAAVVLSLRDNHDPLHVALEMGLAISTVRSHLKHAFRKTGTTRQSELLRLTDRLLSAAPS